MVKLADVNPDVASELWLERLSARVPQNERALLRRAHAWTEQHYAQRMHPSGQPWQSHARAAAWTVGGLRVGGEAVAAAMLLGADLATRAQREALQAEFGSAVLSLVEGTSSMAQIQALRSSKAGAANDHERAAQLEALRKMFLAMAQDVRVVLIKLADQVQLLREVVLRDARARQEIARETLELFSPLANRLGVWQLKWELEDFAFRCLEPQTYRDLARDLDEKRADREAYIGEVIDLLRTELAAAGIAAEVSGRPKHIYSIWRKMQRKGVGLDQLSDVRAVRVIVEDVKDCYAVLGIVHNLWTPIPREFDDYIARPKANDYRSLHTAVIGPERRILEVQIRTQEMHQHAEFGIAAHWRYKEALRGDRSLDDKISWLRNVLEWRDELADVGELAQSFRTDLFADTVYVVTPQGRVIDLPRGSTPIDFAYQLHSELGHRCRGARVNGHIVPLTHVLANGERVEIIAAKDGGPSRDWLNPALGYLKSHRARAKVRQWFNNQQLDEAVAHGRALLEKELQRLGKTGQNLEDLAARMDFDGLHALFAAVGRGGISPRQLQAAVLGTDLGPLPPVALPQGPVRMPGRGTGVLVVGVDKLLTVLARCCKPVPPDRIVGFVTRGRGVTVHRADCHNVARLPGERLIASDWGQAGVARFPVDIEVVGGSQPRLMRDVLDVFTREKVRVTSSVCHVQDPNAKMGFTLEVEDLAQLARLLSVVRDISGVASVRRK